VFHIVGIRALIQKPLLMLGADQALTHAQKTDEVIQALQAEVNDAREQSSRLVSRMDDLSRKVVRLQGSDRNDWLLAEAEYLLRLANQRLLTMRDVKSAMTTDE
jgi:uroporphyrin-3 C-methyltransferase